jgi:hypothetical protein
MPLKRSMLPKPFSIGIWIKRVCKKREKGIGKKIPARQRIRFSASIKRLLKCSFCMFKMRRLPFSIEFDRNHIKAKISFMLPEAVQIELSCLADLLLFSCVYGLFGSTIFSVYAAASDLNKDQSAFKLSNNIDFPSAAAPISIMNTVAQIVKISRSDFLSLCSNPLSRV